VRVVVLLVRADIVITVALSVALAAWVTDHVALSVGLMRRRPWWRGVLALLVAPLAPVFGIGARLWVRSALWIALALTYVVLRLRAQA